MPELLHMCTQCAELPSNMSTMIWNMTSTTNKKVKFWMVWNLQQVWNGPQYSASLEWSSIFSKSGMVLNGCSTHLSLLGAGGHVLGHRPQRDVVQPARHQVAERYLHTICTWWPRSYRKYILQITQPSQYRYAKLQYRFAITSGSPSIHVFP